MSSQGSSQKKNIISAGEVTAIVLVVILILVAGLYIAAAVFFETHFYPNTYVNGVSVAFENVESANLLVSADTAEYTVSFTDDRENMVTLSQQQLGVTLSYNTQLGELLRTQNYRQWIKEVTKRRSEYMHPVYYCDKSRLTETVQGLECVTRTDSQPPEDAFVFYRNGTGFDIALGKRGDTVDADALVAYIMDCVAEGKDTVTVKDVDIYAKAAVTQDSPELIAKAAALNAACQGSVTYTLRGEKVVCDADVYHDWLTEDNGTVTIEEGYVIEYVTNLADKYDTYGDRLSFVNSWGVPVSVKRAESGWQTDIEGETAQLIKDLCSGKAIERDIVSANAAESHGVMDFGDSYLEVNLTRQHLMMYIDGELFLETDFVSGKTTPTGLYHIYKKQTSRVLRGEGYASYVDYWMPFHGAYGLHDANWRSSFGGTIYKYNGSHGCINLPVEIAPQVYNNVDIGFPVVVYYEP